MDISHSCNPLNDDVLREIFIFCISDPHRDTTFAVEYWPKPSIRDLPQLSVSHVSSQWRHLALHTPQLWNKINIVDLGKASLQVAREYLARADNFPVSISLGNSEYGNARSLTDFLSPYRLQAISITGSFSHFPRILLDLPQRCVADLESLIVSCRHVDHGSTINLDDGRYPKLAVVSMTGRYRISCHSGSLRIFNGKERSMTISQSWELLRHCPALEEAWLNMAYENVLPDVLVSHINHQHLRILKVRSTAWWQRVRFSVFISVLTLPKLEELVVTEWCTTAFRLLAQRSGRFSNLKKISLIHPQCDNFDAGILFASIPSVTDVTLCSRQFIDNTPFDDVVLNGLASGSLAPRLQSLRLGHIQDVGTILDMAESRMKNAEMSSDGVPAPFTEIVFHHEVTVGQQDLPIVLLDFCSSICNKLKEVNY